MHPQLHYPELLQPLSPGNTVNAGIRLYRAHFKEYSGIAITTVLWIAGLLILAVPIAFIFYAVLPSAIATLLIIPLGFVLSFYCFGRYLAGSAAISRLVFKELLGEPETAKDAKRFTNARAWGFWVIGLILFVLFFALIIGMYLALAIVLALILGSIGGFTALQNNSFGALEGLVRNPATAIALFLGILALIIFFTIAWTWVAARFAITELPYGIEPETKAADSVGRSWTLTQKNIWHTVIVLFISSLIMVPVSVVFQIISSILQLVLVGLPGTDNSAVLGIVYLASFALGLLGIVITLPIAQSIKGVLYFDLRNRREGLKLQLRSNEPGDRVLEDRVPVDHAPVDHTPVMPTLELFKKVTLLTPESVELEFILAGIGNRALALLIDNLLVLLGISFFWFFGILFATQVATTLSPSSYAVAVLWFVAIAILGTFVISAGYFVLFETLRQGQTPGKRFAQIRVIRDDGRPVGLAQSVLRALLRPIDDTFFIVGAVLILFDQNEKRLGDLVAGTLVIQEERRLVKRAIALSDSAQSLARQLPTLSDMPQLQPDDFAVVREFLQRRDFLTSKARTDLSMNLARQARTLVHLETIPAGVTSDQFLEAIYLVYQSGGT
jgi:uncharacterized RDD family membrane protein YckC